MASDLFVAFAEAPVMQANYSSDSSDSYVSNDIRTSDSQPDAWDLREAMETGALPGQRVDSSESVCCGGIEGPTIESGGQLFRPDVDSGP